MKNNPKHVVVAVSMKSPASRQVLRGIYRFVADFGDWNISLVRGREELPREVIEDFKKDGVDGVFVGFWKDKNFAKESRNEKNVLLCACCSCCPCCLRGSG